MSANASTVVRGAEHADVADDGQVRSAEPPAEGDANSASMTAHAQACSALEHWKAANPWWMTAKNKQLPQTFWDLRRRVRNSKRSLQQHAKQKEKRQAYKRKAASQDPEEMSSEQIAQHAAEVKVARQRRMEAQLAQQARVELALREGLRIVVDCSFIAACSAREMRSLAKQLQQCVAVNRRAERPVCLTFMAYTGPLREFCQKMGGERWAANRVEGALLDSIPASSLVMLSPDAKQPLEMLDPGKVYCVGGLVDRSPRNGITIGFAEQHGIEVRRLPIEEQQLKTAGGAPMHDKRIILNVDSVVAALVAVHGGSSWAAALDAAVPMRKRLPVTAGGTGGNAGGNGNADGAATVHASDSESDSASAEAGAAGAQAASTDGSGSMCELTRQRQQQHDGALAEVVGAATCELQTRALNQQRQPQ